MMATVLYGPEQSVTASPVHNGGGALDYLALDDAKTSSPTHGSRSHVDSLPLLNANFVFPAAAPSPTSASFSSIPVPRRRRPLSAVETHTRSVSLAADNVDRIPRHTALPEFSFNPGASLPLDSSALFSPPVSPNSLQANSSSSRSMGHGHRRGGSEFVGGRLREGSSIAVMSTSPTKLETDLASPMLQPIPPRRGHRRGISGTISTNDLPIFPSSPIVNTSLQGNSAPSSPVIFECKDNLPSIVLDDQTTVLPEPMQPVKDDEKAGNLEAAPQAPAGEPEKHVKTAMRTRVGFSDTLEFIPRPLSLISSDASSTATARPSHSVSNSISSVVSAVSPSGRDSPTLLSRAPTSEIAESRPSTAGAILERTTTKPQVINEAPTSPRRRNSTPTLLNFADANPTKQSTSSSIRSSKRWSFFSLDAFASGSPTKGRPGSFSSSDSASRAVDLVSYSDHGSESSVDRTEAVCGKHKKKGKKNSRKKKVKGWAGSILPLKGHKKRVKPNAVRPPTPPASVSHLDDENENEIDGEMQGPEMNAPIVTITESPTPPQRGESPKRLTEDTAFPMIDLDAALGPFNTPLSFNPEWEAAQRAAGNTGRRRLHSAQGMKGFSGPGMHYHRRTESAPDLPPFDPGRSIIHRYGSSSAMADVFEEDEEDEEEKGSIQVKLEASDESDGELTPPAVASAAKEAFPDIQDKLLRMMRRRSSGMSERESLSTHSIRAQVSKMSLREDVIVEEPTLPFSHVTSTFQGPRDSFDSGAPSPRQIPGTAEASVDEFPLALSCASAMPLSPYSISHASSSHPSPRSPISVDAQRISTAPSSVTDDSFHSLLMGEPGPEVRISMDYDIPSLTSSNSTMTRDSSFIPLPRSRPTAPRGQRPVSVSSVAFGRRRSSLASLSRLISSSHGERSKLSVEVTLDSEPEPKTTKSSKAKRLSRMIQFWKPSKDDAAA